MCVECDSLEVEGFMTLGEGSCRLRGVVMDMLGWV